MTNYWDTFMKMVELEYEIQTNYSDAIISMVSNNLNLVDNTGRVIAAPLTTQFVTYTINVTIGEATKSITLGSVIPGTNSWSQYDGMFSTR